MSCLEELPELVLGLSSILSHKLQNGVRVWLRKHERPRRRDGDGARDARKDLVESVALA